MGEKNVKQVYFLPILSHSISFLSSFLSVSYFSLLSPSLCLFYFLSSIPPLHTFPLLFLHPLRSSLSLFSHSLTLPLSPLLYCLSFHTLLHHTHTHSPSTKNTMFLLFLFLFFSFCSHIPIILVSFTLSSFRKKKWHNYLLIHSFSSPSFIHLSHHPSFYFPIFQYLLQFHRLRKWQKRCLS